MNASTGRPHSHYNQSQRTHDMVIIGQCEIRVHQWEFESNEGFTCDRR
jgi:hypothetical protein